MEREHGQQRRTAAAPVVEHIRLLLGQGWTGAQIARAAGCPPRTVTNIGAAAYPTVGIEQARKILSVPSGPPPGDSRDIDATGTRRRIQALVAMGHLICDIAEVAQMHHDPLARIARGEQPAVRKATATRIATAYRHMISIPGTSQRALAKAARHGWHGPLAWDSSTIDDPAAEPELFPDPIVELSRDELAAVRRAEIEHFDLLGLSEHEIADKLGMAYTTVRNIVLELRSGQRRIRPREGAQALGSELAAAA
ncbi:hypothetical protein ACIQVR_39370 [Streptomyces xanthochromogenes]|uniref:hypothetical protein n=1 Tax=Streptomyces xanthochromogenes TaxID=67384 RepID=UPI00380F0691